MKGISPLIAAVLLIAFTMAIAGIMATWATEFSQGQLGEAGEGAVCIGSLDLDETTLSFNSGVVSLKIRNKNNKFNLTGLKADLDYTDPSMSLTDIMLGDYNVSDPLRPASSSWFIYDTGNPVPPTRITVIAENCAKYPAALDF